MTSGVEAPTASAPHYSEKHIAEQKTKTVVVFFPSFDVGFGMKGEN
jgi:hypothetical protein